MTRPRLKKALGQHHLTRPELCRPLVDFLAPSGERVVEVGPGGGVLTGQLLDAGARVWGVELDLEWAWELRRAMHARGSQTGGDAALRRSSLQPLVMDALDLPWSRLPAPTLVAGNLPYNVATPILAAVLPHWARIPRAAFLLQKEVAERLTAKPGTRDYGSLTVLVQCYADAAILGRVRPGSFRPPPKVESAFVGLRLHAPPLPEGEMPAFIARVREAFGQKRKTLRNALGRIVGSARVEAALRALDLPPPTRAEELPLDRWLALWPLVR
ncbi:MAG TPA: 16S rRNA (adenine(1518)-N(6)/adenine(1519)-N(6))-dimethyltransferase RsmA [Thermoanaerobaculia bacterium]|nr:16S rRNA (adenine(1518)-N(6)/adenine(1519)-N(6))-dimethyltransferase RsmA [Thermoanaerobaculia bacterium]